MVKKASKKNECEPKQSDTSASVKLSNSHRKKKNRNSKPSKIKKNNTSIKPTKRKKINRNSKASQQQKSNRNSKPSKKDKSNRYTKSSAITRHKPKYETSDIANVAFTRESEWSTFNSPAEEHLDCSEIYDYLNERFYFNNIIFFNIDRIIY